ncbi:MAG: hypothetical protein IGS23_05775 [Rivularia sp. T60_A2020_040]|nr:hypothetical protein [Rivularia sp. T60_A2020_040]
MFSDVTDIYPQNPASVIIVVVYFPFGATHIVLFNFSVVLKKAIAIFNTSTSS